MKISVVSCEICSNIGKLHLFMIQSCIMQKETNQKVYTFLFGFVMNLSFFPRNLELSPYQENNKQYSRLVSRNNEIMIQTDNSFRPRKMHFWNTVMPTINNSSTQRANEVKMNSSSVSCVNCFIIFISCTMTFVFSV